MAGDDNPDQVLTYSRATGNSDADGSFTAETASGRCYYVGHVDGVLPAGYLYRGYIHRDNRSTR